jgi:hypothetical protein
VTPQPRVYLDRLYFYTEIHYFGGIKERSAVEAFPIDKRVGHLGEY